MLKISNIVSQIDSFVWGPVMLVLLVGTGVQRVVEQEMFPRFPHLQPPLRQQSEPEIS